MTFLEHAQAHGLILREVIADGQWHRTATTDKRKSKKNGAYLFDGVRGVVRNWATMHDYAAYREGGSESKLDREALREFRRQHAAEQAQRHEAARVVSADMVKRAVVGPHPYLSAKGFPKETGFLLDGELLIPMRDCRRYKTLNGLQRISADGTKKFLPGSKAKESIFCIGSFSAQERWICEGYSTALSIKAAVDDLRRNAQVVVTFSAGNLIEVGRWARDLRALAFVFADNDFSEAGANAARATGLPWSMPPIVGQDANDYHKQFGLRALVNLIREVRDPSE